LDDARLRQVARAHLDLAAALARRRDLLEYELDELAARAGIPAARLAEIEEGDTTSLTEVLHLCAALGLRLDLASVDPHAPATVLVLPPGDDRARGAA